MAITSVAVPGPWWTLLSYTAEKSMSCGLRVRVPLGNSFRIGLTAQGEENNDDIKKLKHIEEVIDESPPLPDELWKTLNWFGETWFIGLGMAAKTLLPSRFLLGEQLDPFHPIGTLRHDADVKYFYDPNDDARYGFYEDMLASSKSGSLIIFPEVLSAKKFWERLPEAARSNGVLWPASGPAKQWDIWKKSRTGEIQFIVGSQGAAFVPLAGLSKIIVDEEFSGAWKTQKHPLFHRRTLLAARAKFAGAQLVLGGRMPSAKASGQCDTEQTKGRASNRLIFVDLHDSSNMDIAGIKDTLPVSRPLMRETIDCIGRGEWVFWLLDRKGYAGEIYCADCGASVRCARCGGIMRWEGRRHRLACLNCDSKTSVPEKCPACGGPFLEGLRPGIEALTEKAASLLKYKRGEVLLFQDDGNKIPPSKTLLKERPDGGVIIGTRKILSLADELSPGLIGWIDADSEARVAEYDAKARAFALIWESIWRGKSPEGRKIVIQSRRPGKGWQKGLTGGWKVFWNAELRERKELGLPPFLPLLRIQMPEGRGAILLEALDKSEFEYWESDESADEIWVRTRRFDLVRELLAPYYHIRNTRIGFPTVQISLD